MSKTGRIASTNVPFNDDPVLIIVFMPDVPDNKSKLSACVRFSKPIDDPTGTSRVPVSEVSRLGSKEGRSSSTVDVEESLVAVDVVFGAVGFRVPVAAAGSPVVATSSVTGLSTTVELAFRLDTASPEVSDSIGVVPKELSSGVLPADDPWESSSIDALPPTLPSKSESGPTSSPHWHSKDTKNTPV